MGQVLEYHVASGQVTARVQGSQPKPYDIDIKIRCLSTEEWDEVSEAMAGQAIFAAKLLAGEMPQNIEEAFTTANLNLFPQSAKDLDTSCSCPDWANPCKHIAAVYYLLGEEFDRDPFMLFQLRGRSREELIAVLREKRSTAADSGTGGPSEVEEGPPETSPPLEECLHQFWVAGAELAGFQVSVAPPAVPEALLKRLGPLPLLETQEDIIAMLRERYGVVSQRALDMAFGEESLF
jgi:uncharacterized Zn finger protein